jgi:hypothetical protein
VARPGAQDRDRARPAATADDGPACATDPLYGHPPARWADVPAGAPSYALVGYGALDEPARRLARAVLDGTTPMPDSADADRFFAADRQVREAEHTVFGGL